MRERFIDSLTLSVSHSFTLSFSLYIYIYIYIYVYIYIVVYVSLVRDHATFLFMIVLCIFSLAFFARYFVSGYDWHRCWPRFGSKDFAIISIDCFQREFFNVFFLCLVWVQYLFCWKDLLLLRVFDRSLDVEDVEYVISGVECYLRLAIYF